MLLIILYGKHITQGYWQEYNFLNDINLGYTHESHSHIGGDFEEGIYNIADIE